MAFLETYLAAGEAHVNQRLAAVAAAGIEVSRSALWCNTKGRIRCGFTLVDIIVFTIRSRGSLKRQSGSVALILNTRPRTSDGLQLTTPVPVTGPANSLFDPRGKKPRGSRLAQCGRGTCVARSLHLRRKFRNSQQNCLLSGAVVLRQVRRRLVPPPRQAHRPRRWAFSLGAISARDGAACAPARPRRQVLPACPGPSAREARRPLRGPRCWRGAGTSPGRCSRRA